MRAAGCSCAPTPIIARSGRRRRRRRRRSEYLRRCAPSVMAGQVGPLTSPLLLPDGLIAPDRLDDRPSTYSGGMRQRLQIARNLVISPRLVFMDEPTGGLDVSVQARLLDLIRGLIADMGLAVVLVTHDLSVARLLSNRILVM